MKEIIEIIRREKLESIILKFIIMLFCLFTIILNSETYMAVFKSINKINSHEELQKAVDENEKFITLDLTDAKLMKYSIVSSENDRVNIYSISFDNKNLLIALKDNTALTDNVTGELLEYDSNMKDIKEKLEYNSNNKYEMTKYFSNVSYVKNENMIKIKFYFILLVLLLMIITLPFNIYLYVYPKKTKKYEKLKKELL